MRLTSSVCIACFAALFFVSSADFARAIGITTLFPTIDFDGDGVNDIADNSPGQSNPGQEDSDMDQIGDVGEVYMGLNPSLPDTDGDGDIDFTDTAPLGIGSNDPQFNLPYVVDFDPSYTVQIGQTLIMPFTFTHAVGASDDYLQVKFDLAINGVGDDFWYFCQPSVLTPVLTPADMATLGINSPGTYTVTTRGGEFGWVSTDSFLIHVMLPEPSTLALLLIGGAAMLRRRR